MLQVSGLFKAYGPQTLFEQASFRLNRGDRAALVGPNGAGKTTLFSMILGEAEPDQGEISFEKNTQLGHLAQETAPSGDESVLQIAAAISPEHATLLKQIGSAERAGRQDEAYYSAIERYTELGGFEIEPRAKKILSGLSFRKEDFDQPLRSLSGGWVMRAHLAKLLTAEPDFLMLDEPTNHLDLESLQWFQNHLRNYPGSLLIISHDRAFLNEVVDTVLEVRHQRIHLYRGNYDDYLMESKARDEQQMAAFRSQEKKIAQLERFVDRFGAKATKAAQAKSKQKQIDRMDRIEAPITAEKTIKVTFPQPEPSGQRVITLEEVHFAYPGKPVYQGIDLSIERGERIVLVGPNGAGKSTLLKILAGVNVPQAGSRTEGHNTKVGYFSQSRTDMLDPERTVLEEVQSIRRPIEERFARTVLGSFLFRGEAVFKKVKVLSGGEKSRLGLVKLLLDPPNLMLMDEPTTHLDMASIDALIAALTDFRGTLVFISHDVHFIRSLSERVLRISAGEITPFAGGYDYYLMKSGAENARDALVDGEKLSDYRPSGEKTDRSHSAPATKSSGFKTKEQKRAEAEARKKRAKIRSQVEKIELQICSLEERQAHLSKEMEDPELYESDPGRVMALNREVIEIEEKLEALNRQWERDTEALED